MNQPQAPRVWWIYQKTDHFGAHEIYDEEPFDGRWKSKYTQVIEFSAYEELQQRCLYFERELHVAETERDAALERVKELEEENERFKGFSRLISVADERDRYRQALESIWNGGSTCDPQDIARQALKGSDNRHEDNGGNVAESEGE